MAINGALTTELGKSSGEKKRIQNQAGFSIIEILFSLFMLAIIISGLVPLLTKAISTNQQSKNKLYAYQAANAELENIRNTSFLDINDYPFSIPTISSSQGNVVISDEIDGIIETDILKATVTVTWTFKSKQETVELITYVAKKGIIQ